MANPFYKLLQEISDNVAASNPPKKIMNVDDLALYTGFSKSYIYRLCSERLLKHYKPQGKMVFFKRDEVDKWLLSNPVPTLEQLSLKSPKRK